MHNARLSKDDKCILFAVIDKKIERQFNVLHTTP